MTEQAQLEPMEQIQRILTFSLQRIFRYGYSSITIDEIAAELRISKATFYRFFKSKEELVERVVREYADSIISQFTTKKISTVQNFMDEFRAAATHIADMIGQLDSRAGADLRAVVPKIWKQLYDLRHRSFVSILSGVMKAGIDCGVIRPTINADTVSELLSVSLESILSNDNLQNRGIDWIDVLGTLGDVLFNGIRAVPAKTAT